MRHSLAFVPYRNRKDVAADLREIYTASDEGQALEALARFEQKWSKKYPTIAPSWRRNWSRIVPFLAFPPEIRKMIYTTNAIESLNSVLRKAVRAKGHFPNEEAALKLMYLALRNVEKKWRGEMKDWKRISAQLRIFFEDRLPA